MAATDPKQGANIIWKLLILTRRSALRKKPRRTIKQTKTTRMHYIWFWVHWLVEHAPKPVQYQFTKLGPLTSRKPKEGAKLSLKWLFLTRSPVLTKKQRGLSNREKLRECLIFDSGCTGSQSTLQNLLNITLPNLVGWLQETLSKKRKLFRSDSF